jgi:hypothetical protein
MRKGTPALQVLGQHVRRETRLLLVEVNRHELEAHRRLLLQRKQRVEQPCESLPPERHTITRSPSAIIAKSLIASPTWRRMRLASFASS